MQKRLGIQDRTSVHLPEEESQIINSKIKVITKRTHKPAYSALKTKWKDNNRTGKDGQNIWEIVLQL